MPSAQGSASRLASNSAAREKTLMSAHCAASSASAGTGSARAANARRTGHKAAKTGSKAARSPSARRHISRCSAARAPRSTSAPERTPRAVLAARRDRATARRRRPCPYRGRCQGERQKRPDHPAPHLASYAGCSLAASTGIGGRATDRDTLPSSLCRRFKGCARGRGPMRLVLATFLLAAPAFAGRPFTPEELLATRRLDDPQVSPDGKQVAFTVRQKSLELNRDVKDVWLQPLAGGPARQWTEWKDGKRTHVFVQPAQGGPARDVTPGDSDWPTFRVGGGDDMAFTPDGAEVIVSAKPAQREAWSTNGDLWTIPVQGGAPRNLTPGNPGDDASPKPSPDERWLAWLAQARNGYESDQWKLMLMDRRTGKASVIGDFGDDVGPFSWQRDSSGLVAAVQRHGRTYLNTVSLEGRVARYAESPASSDFALAADGSVVFVQSGMVRPPELSHLAPGGRPKRLTAFSQEQYAGIDMPADPQDLWIEAKDGAKVHSWIVRPPGGKRAPLLLLIHGGPQGTWEDEWGMRWNEAAFAARGYVVLAVDPRGSTGYGRAFEEQISGDWGGLAYDDLMRSVDAAEKLPYVLPGRTCAAGASFGGYLIE